ncbi:MAG: efflux RND transporter permease subunit [Gemmatimonadales bacterium]|nr:efflux RND transporter permease subunit [Gemmatimonadales bacterium]
MQNIGVGSSSGGRPVRVADVATVTLGPDIRTGIAEHNGQGEAVGGVVVMRAGANALDVAARVKARLAELAPSLPPGVVVVTTYGRASRRGAGLRASSDGLRPA